MGAISAFAVLQGISTLRESGVEAESQEEQGNIAAEEAGEEAERVGKERRVFKGKQALSFLKSGVKLSGTSLDVLARTEVETGRQVKSIKARGAAQRKLFRQKASITRRSGRARAFASFGQAATSGGGQAATSGGGQIAGT